MPPPHHQRHGGFCSVHRIFSNIRQFFLNHVLFTPPAHKQLFFSQPSKRFNSCGIRSRCLSSWKPTFKNSFHMLSKRNANPKKPTTPETENPHNSTQRRTRSPDDSTSTRPEPAASRGCNMRSGSRSFRPSRRTTPCLGWFSGPRRRCSGGRGSGSGSPLLSR